MARAMTPEEVPVRTSMRTTRIALALAAALFGVAPALAEPTVKIGLIMPYSGQFADPAAQMDNAIKLYMKQNGDTVAGKKIEAFARTRAAWRPTSPSVWPRS